MGALSHIHRGGVVPENLPVQLPSEPSLFRIQVASEIFGERLGMTILATPCLHMGPECTKPSHSQSLANVVANVHLQGTSAASHSPSLPNYHWGRKQLPN